MASNIEHAHTLGDAVQLGGNMLGMVAAGIIIMRQQHHVSAAQGFVVFGAPLASAHRIRRRDEAESGNVVRVFLPLANKDRRAVSDRLGDIRQSVQYQRGCVECPALALCWPLGESGFLEWQPILRRSHAHIFSGSETPDPKSAFGGGSPLSKGLWVEAQSLMRKLAIGRDVIVLGNDLRGLPSCVIRLS